MNNYWYNDSVWIIWVFWQYDWHWLLVLVSMVTHYEPVTLSMSAASVRLWAMSSDSVNRSFSKAVLYSCPTSSLCRQSFTWFTRKCITAFGTLRPSNNILTLDVNHLRGDDSDAISNITRAHYICTCLGCSSEQLRNTTWWVSQWPHSPSAPEQTTSWTPEQAANETPSYQFVNRA